MMNVSNPSTINSLLIEASNFGDSESVEQILSFKNFTREDANELETRVRSPHYGLTALHRAKTPQIANMLIQFGLDVNKQGIKGQTPLHTNCDNPPVMQVLLEHGAKCQTTIDGSTPLEWAVVSDCLDCAKLLLEYFGDEVALQKNKNGNTPLHLVSSKKMTELLLNHGARVSEENNLGQIPLESANERVGDSDHAAITELLLDVSEDRGFKFRSARNLFSPEHATAAAHSPVSQKDSFGTDKRKHGWDLVKEVLLPESERGLRHRGVSLSSEWVDESFRRNGGGSTRPLFRMGSSSSHFSETGEVDDSDEEGDPINPFYTRFFEMAILERPHLALRILDRHRQFCYAKGSSKFYKYDFSLLGGVDKSSMALRFIVENDRRDLVAHDLVQWLITAKWALFSHSQLMEEGLFYFAFLLLFTVNSLNPHNNYERILETLVLLLSLRFMLRFLLEWKKRTGNGELDVLSRMRKSDKFTGPVFFVVPVIILLDWIANVNTAYLETMASLLLWIRVLYFMEALNETVGLTMRIVRSMLADIAVYVFVQFVFLVGFAHAMTITFRNSSDSTSFGSFPKSFTTLFFFIFNLDPDPIFEEENIDRRVVAMLLLGFFECLVVILFLNLMVAVMASSFERIMSEAKSEWLLVRAKFCIRMEDQVLVEFGSVLAKKRKKSVLNKRKFLVEERSNGRNMVSLPRDSLTSPSGFWGWWGNSEEKETPEIPSAYGSFNSHQGSVNLAPETVVLGSFERHSKAQGNLVLGEDVTQFTQEKLLATMKLVLEEMDRRKA